MVNLRRLKGENKEMMYVKGRFVNANGLERRPWYFAVSSNKLRDFKLAMQLYKKKSVLVMVSDRRKYVRIAHVEPKIIKTLPNSGKCVGNLIAILKASNGRPIELFKLVQSFPDDLKNITVAEIAALHLPSLNRKLDPNVHHLPK